MDSYYALLKVTRESKFPEDVTKSYRRLSLKLHPDKGGAPGRQKTSGGLRAAAPRGAGVFLNISAKFEAGPTE